MQSMRKWVLVLAVVALFIPLGPAGAGAPDASPFAGKLPRGWRELKLGQSEDAVRQAVQKLKGPQAKPWEKTPLTSFVLPDVAAGKLTKIDVDARRVHHWMANDLTEGVATTRAWFDGGKLVAVNVLSTLGYEEFVRKAAEAYGAEPRRLKLTLADETGSSAPRQVDAAFWRGNGVTALIYQPSGWGPELLIASDAGLEALRALHARDPHGMGAGSAGKEETRF